MNLNSGANWRFWNTVVRKSVPYSARHLTQRRFQFSLPPSPPPKTPPPPPPTSRNIPMYVWAPVVGICGTSVYTYYAYQEEVPLTKRKRWIVTSPKLEWQLGEQQYKQLQQQFQKDVLPPNHRASITVQRVGSRIVAASEKFIQQNHLEHVVSKSPYTYTVVRSDMANAFVLPNNHVFVLTGLFQYVKDEDELAAILGHELAHNLARHVGEKLSEHFVIMLLAPISFLIDPSGMLGFFLSRAITLLRELPHSREQEMEADQIGVFLAAEACYDPRAAKRVFAAMKEGGAGSPAVEFLSTHPSHDRRISNFDKWMPDAMNTFEADLGHKCRHIRQEMAEARKVAALQAAQREQQQQRKQTWLSPSSSSQQQQQQQPRWS